ncbi:uncharacterized protein LOC125178206 isoform X2 [Hyalella azteca]|uniref:Uncharacterized protein LOC125178206 isoform X2 n=1 Tax=Hyalella azteca TaxID=294128 RepID=A0A979FL11_HYAAZ|nr:uncharacterized protein LOC125178206 isoform X2 [Hyalella azteca]
MLHGKLDVGTFPGAEPCVAGARALAVRWHGLPQQLLRLRAAALRPGYLRLGQLLHAHQAPVQRKNNGMLGDMCTPSLGKLYVGNMVMSGSMFAGVNEKLAFIWEPVINQITGATDWGHVSPTTPRCGSKVQRPPTSHIPSDCQRCQVFTLSSASSLLWNETSSVRLV